METLNRFSLNYKKSLKAAADLALELRHQSIDPAHLLYGLATQKGSVGAELFAAAQVKTEDIKNDIARAALGQLAPETKDLPGFSDLTRRLIQKSVQIAYQNRHRYVGTEHLLAALVDSDDGLVKKLLLGLKIPTTTLTEQVTATLKSASRLPEITGTFRVISGEIEEEEETTGQEQSALETFGVNLASPKMQKQLDPVIGREAEISRVIQILSRRSKNNPLILGDPGVGKTAIVEGLAKKIAAGEVPEAISNKKIYTLDLAAAVAGTIYRGEFEARLKQIIEEVKRRPEVILFIDEIHNLVGAGAASGSMDAANILKPALARGEVRIIGATTFEDYRKSIENDPALARRLQPVKITEPTAEEARQILRGLAPYFEKFHKIQITDEARDAAVALSQRYMPEKFLPDKAIDLIDEAAAAAKVGRQPSLWEQRSKKLNEEILRLCRAKETAVANEDFELALRLQAEEKQLLEQRETLEQDKPADDQYTNAITASDIANIVAKATGIPLSDLSAPRQHLLGLEKRLAEKIVGQDDALTAIATFVKRAQAGLMPDNRPLASFLFVGQSGVGKTHTARELARLVFGSDQALIKIDMSELGERFNVSRLIGAPAGYVGYKESGQLTEKIKHRPYSLLLLDEIEKANPEVFDLLLQILDDGQLTDAAGARINFRNTIVIMTSNLGSQYFDSGPAIGFGAETADVTDNIKEKVMGEAKNVFKPEFINRLDQIIYFQPLNIKHLRQIARLTLAELAMRLKRQGVALDFDAPVLSLLAEKSQGAGGARAISRTVQGLIESPLADQLLGEEIKAGDTVRLTAKSGIIKIEKG